MGAVLLRSIRVSGVCAGQALAWAVVALTVLCPYAGPFCPIGEYMWSQVCSGSGCHSCCPRTMSRSHPLPSLLKQAEVKGIKIRLCGSNGKVDVVKPPPGQLYGGRVTLQGARYINGIF